jgi:hypothetical protein
MSEKDQYLKQIDKIVSSHGLHGSESLCKLLRYFAHHALDHPGSALKEYQIATEVFGRPADFDPQVDSTIRVQAGRLRTKLSEYYGSEGAEDPIQVELPKGTYVLSFHHRAQNGRNHASALPPEPERDSTQSIASRWRFGFMVVSVFLAVALVVIMALAASRRSGDPAQTSERQPAPGSLRVFWNPFVKGPEEPWVIFSNAAFIGRPETGMRYYTPAGLAGPNLGPLYRRG